MSKYPIIHLPGPSWLRKNPYAAEDLWFKARLRLEFEAWAANDYSYEPPQIVHGDDRDNVDCA